MPKRSILFLIAFMLLIISGCASEALSPDNQGDQPDGDALGDPADGDAADDSLSDGDLPSDGELPAADEADPALSDDVASDAGEGSVDGADPNPGDGAAPLRIAMIDAPIDEAEAVYIEITSIRVHNVHAREQNEIGDGDEADEGDEANEDGDDDLADEGDEADEDGDVVLKSGRPDDTPDADDNPGSDNAQNGDDEDADGDDPAEDDHPGADDNPGDDEHPNGDDNPGDDEHPNGDDNPGDENRSDEGEQTEQDGQEDVGEWIEMAMEPIRLNLLDLQNNVSAMLADRSLPEGDYNEIRFVLNCEDGHAPSIVIAGEEHELTMPSGCVSGLKLQHEFQVTDGQVTSLIVDFDVRKSIHETGNGEFIMQPVLRVVHENMAGVIEGRIMQADSDVIAYAFDADADISDLDAAVASSIPADNGVFKLAALPAGTYTVLLASEQYGDFQILDVEVVAGEHSELGLIDMEAGAILPDDDGEGEGDDTMADGDEPDDEGNEAPADGDEPDDDDAQEPEAEEADAA